jgi:hypothetical protein
MFYNKRHSQKGVYFSVESFFVGHKCIKCQKEFVIKEMEADHIKT